MSKVTAVSRVASDRYGRCDIDQLDEIELQEGEKLEVTFPDGEKQMVEVVIHTSEERQCFRSEHTDVTVRKAFFTLNYHGWELDFPLEDLEAKRIK